MGFITKTLEKRSIKDPALRDLWGIGGVSKSGVSVSPSSAMTCVPYFAGVRLIAETAGQLPLVEYQRLNPRGKRRATDRRLYYLLHDEPNPEMSAVSFKEALQGQCVTWGNAFAEIDWDMDTGAPRSIWPLQSSRMKVGRDPVSKELLYVYSLPDGKVVNLPAYRVWHMPGYGYDGLIGYDTIHLFREAIGLALGLEEFGARFFGNGTNTGGFLQHPNKLSKEAFDRLKNSMAEQYEGLSNAHRLMILEDGMTYSKIGIPPDNAQFLESRKFQKNEIATILHIPPHMIGDLEHATFCLPADAQIFTEHGNKAIKDIAAGEKVWSRDSGKWVLSSVEASACTGIDEVLEIKTGIRTLRANAKHHVPVRRKVMKAYTGGRGKYSVINGKRARPSYEIQWIPAGDIRIGDELLALNGLPDSGTVSSPTRNCSEAFMESLGMIIGDGFFARNSKTGEKSTFGISHGEHDTQLPHYINAIESEFRACDGPYGMKNGGSTLLKAKSRDKNTTVFYSTLACAELESIGISGTAKTKRIPEWIFGLSESLKLAFLRGYLDSDGTVNKAGHIRYVSVNKELLEDVRHLCMSAGVRTGNLFHTDIESDFGTEKTYKHRLYGFICSHAEDNMRISSYSVMHSERMHAISVNRGKRKAPIYPCEAKRRATETGLLFTKVLTIEKEAGKVPVYDLTVAGTHNFIADGVLVRNSNIEHQGIEFVTYTMTPWLTRWEETCNRKLLLPSERYTYFTEFMVNALLRGDSAARAAYYRERFYLGSLSPNDIRELENENPIPDPNADLYYVQANMLPMSQAGKAQLAPPAAGRGVDDAVKRITERDKANIARAFKKDPAGFETWLNDYFRDFPEFMKKELKPLAGGEPEE